MAGNLRYPYQNWAARGDKVRFIELEDISDVLELQPGSWAQAEEQINKHAELNIKLRQAVTRNSQERELKDQKLKQGQEIEAMIKDKTAENKLLLSHVHKLKQEVAQIKMSRQIKDEEYANPQKASPELRNTVIAQSVCLKNMRNEMNELQEQKKCLTVQLNQLIAEKKTTQESISTYTAAEVTLKVSLEKLKKDICEKDTQMQEMCVRLKAEYNMINDCNIRKELTQDWNQLLDEMRKRQDQIMVMQKLCKERKIFAEAVPELIEPAPISIIEKYQHKNQQANGFFQCCAQRILKVTGTTLCALCALMFMANLVPLFSSPRCDLFTMLCELVESCGDIELVLPSVV